ncbi:hypothetical protein GS982_21295 [Rhodococcus hoagii]|nr:hypothetical protein [Prescottella equi]
MSAVEGLDPTAADFGTQVDAAVAAAVEANPRFRKTRTPVAAPRSGADFSAGNGDPTANAGDTSIDSLRASYRKSRGGN